MTSSAPAALPHMRPSAPPGAPPSAVPPSPTRATASSRRGNAAPGKPSGIPRALARSTGSEWLKLRRPGMVWGGGGTLVGMTILFTILLFSSAADVPNLRAGDCTRDPAIPPTPEEIDAALQARNGTAAQRGPPALPYCLLEQPQGMMRVFGFSAQLMGVVALVLFAQGMGGDYGQGTLKVLLSREPRRLVNLTGKVAAMTFFVWIAVAVAALAQVAAAAAVAGARGIEMQSWWTAEGFLDALTVVGRAELSMIPWGMLGIVLAVALRSAPPAIGIGIGYTVLGEGLLGLAIPDVVKWLPGHVIATFVNWGANAADPTAATVDPTAATIVMGAYALAFGAVAAVLLQRRDVRT